MVPPSLLGPLLGDQVSSAFAVVAPSVLGMAALACVVLARSGSAEPAGIVGNGPRVPVAA